MSLLERHPRIPARLAPLVVLGVCLILAQAASGAQYFVNTAADTTDGTCDATNCTFREAIEAANASVGVADRIDFQIADTQISVASALPAITDRLVIAGNANEFGRPQLELMGPGAGSGLIGVHLAAGSAGSEVDALAIGGFSIGVLSDSGGNTISRSNIGTDVNGLAARPNTIGVGTQSGDLVAANTISGNVEQGLALRGTGNRVLANTIGLNATATAAIPNRVGIEVGAGGANRIGDDELAGQGNLISGNLEDGILVSAGNGSQTVDQIQGNRIGLTYTEVGIGNGGYGIRLSAQTRVAIGGADDAANQIAFNGAGGVRVPEGWARITRNSIHSNGGLGIDISDAGVDSSGGSLQSAPVISAATSSSSSTTVTGTLDGTELVRYDVEFFASADCDPTGRGEGEVFLGRETVSVGEGPARFTATLPRATPAGYVVTATADPEEDFNTTSEFSRCEELGGAAALPRPVLGRQVNVQVVRGIVRVRSPRGRFKRLTGGQQIPVGWFVDTTNGVVRLTSAANARGKTQSANFDSGIFRVGQKRRAEAFTELKLAGPLVGCAKQSAATSARRRRGRRLWGNGSGRFRSVGTRASAGVRGTRWLVEDRCDGSTLVRVRKGRVTVRDFVRRRTITLRAGQRYVARPRRR